MMGWQFPTPAEMAQARADMKAAGEAARMMADEGDKPEAGHFYTVSKSFSNGDGSWTELFWEVLSVSGPKAFVRIHERHGEPIERFWMIEDRAWYLADEAWSLRKEAHQ
ncbi:hypothetical protein [Sulfitobacter sp. 1A12157]|uniref:hypothetical protein n=1 Tax=Sulfitobacter sp. 1A12157 TaxID=3368594 RepID=UPI003746375C